VLWMTTLWYFAGEHGKWLKRWLPIAFQSWKLLMTYCFICTWGLLGSIRWSLSLLPA
jgi:uncharacterized MAPEG superfamily protein